MYRTVCYLPRWTRLLRPPLGQSAAILPSSTARTDITKLKNYSSEPQWTHSGNNGPGNWHKWYPAAKGKSQSPIALYSNSPRQQCDLKLYGYTNTTKLTATNTGSTVSFKCVNTEEASRCHLTGAHEWDEKYALDHLHFHWGVTSVDGSEHTIDDKQFPLELHIVHSLNGISLPEACNHPKGLAVLGFMYEISKDDNPAYMPLIEAMKHITYKGEEQTVDSPVNFNLKSLLPSTLDTGYFYYSGSLTTPPCSEVVQWIVFSDTIPISENQPSEHSIAVRETDALNRCLETGDQFNRLMTGKCVYQHN